MSVSQHISIISHSSAQAVETLLGHRESLKLSKHWPVKCLTCPVTRAPVTRALETDLSRAQTRFYDWIRQESVDISSPASPPLSQNIEGSHWAAITSSWLSETAGVKVYFKQTLRASIARLARATSGGAEILGYWTSLFTGTESSPTFKVVTHHTHPLSGSANKSRCIIVEGFMAAREEVSAAIRTKIQENFRLRGNN